MDFSLDDCICRNPHTYLPVVNQDLTVSDRIDNYRPSDPSVQDIENKLQSLKHRLKITAKEEYQRRLKFFEGADPENYLTNSNYMLESVDIRNYMLNLVETICFLKDFLHHHDKCMSRKSLFYIRE